MSPLLNRTMKTAILLSAIGALALVVACEEKKDPPATPGTTPSAVTSTVAPATTPAAAAGEGDTEEDFEDEAQTAITPDNLETELTKLEAEIK